LACIQRNSATNSNFCHAGILKQTYIHSITHEIMYTVIQIGFATLTATFFYLLYREFKLALPKSSLSIDAQSRFLKIITYAPIGWAVIVSTLSLLGVAGDFSIFPVNIGPLLVIPLIATIIFTFSRSTREVLQHIHPASLVRLQVFRAFVEVLLWMLFIEHLLPEQMTFEGRNFDVISGLTAIPIAGLVTRSKISKTGLILWNLACLGLLINIVTVAVLSMPTPFRYFMNEPVNTIVAEFPIIWLPTFLVPLAYMLHFFSLRQLADKK
jgi:hypothetical protein